ncbi:hypothetical protein [Nocardioides sp. InS609-2]|uniref:hypothetical protein n=1 Tax=Nocardioides sp. InS609-2 TaxID=2760705 RepID=UPI0020BDED18|nr:hypothetical protein [Nocardioides sp. InS609-2]
MAALITRSGEWARIDAVSSRNTAAAMVSRINRSLNGWSGHDWEGRYAEQADGSWFIYVRHIATKEA